MDQDEFSLHKQWLSFQAFCLSWEGMSNFTFFTIKLYPNYGKDLIQFSQDEKHDWTTYIMLCNNNYTSTNTPIEFQSTMMALLLLKRLKNPAVILELPLSSIILKWKMEYCVQHTIKNLEASAKYLVPSTMALIIYLSQ